LKDLTKKRVCCGVILKNNKVLIAKRNDSKYKGLWEFPGGKVKEGESDSHCLERELFEELNIITKTEGLVCEVYHKYSDSNIHLIAYFTRIIKGKPKVSEHSEYKWISCEEFINYKFLEADIPIVEKLSSTNNLFDLR